MRYICSILLVLAFFFTRSDAYAVQVEEVQADDISAWLITNDALPIISLKMTFLLFIVSLV